MSTLEASSVSARLMELKARAAKLRRELAPLAAEADAKNIDAAASIQRIWEEGFFDFFLPEELGGIGDADPGKQTEAFFDLLVDLVAGDSAAGMNFGVHSIVTIEIFDKHNTLPQSTKNELAKLIKEKGIRFCASSAETGSKRPVKGRRAPGGVIVSGTKTFNSNSGGGGIANCAFKIEGEKGIWHGLIPLDQPTVVCHHDWDVMGQRGTHSQSIDYNDVFVPDSHLYPRHGFSPQMMTFVFLLHSAILLGPGYGALDAAIDYVRKLDRPSLPDFASASQDALIRRRLGSFAVTLEQARAYLLRCAHRSEHFDALKVDPTAHAVESLAVKAACVRAGLEVTQGIFDLTGARGTSNKYRFDRFWRNVRTFSTHDSTDAKEVWVGDWYLAGKEPPMVAALRV